MKSQKLFVIAAIGCLLAAASSAAMARNDCPDGALVGGTYKNIIITEPGVNCNILGANVTGTISIRDAGTIAIKGSLVNSRIKVQDSADVEILDNRILGRILSTRSKPTLLVRRNEQSSVLRNVVNIGPVKITSDECETGENASQWTNVIQNLIFIGGLVVECNREATVVENNVRDGTINCPNNLTLTSAGNFAGEGVTCGPQQN